MKNFLENISGLKKYLYFFCIEQTKKSDLLSTNEALKDFAKLWTDHKSDLMMMMTVLEYDFVSKGAYTENELIAVKSTLGKMARFMRECSEEWAEYEAIQEKRKKEK